MLLWGWYWYWAAAALYRWWGPYQQWGDGPCGELPGAYGGCQDPRQSPGKGEGRREGDERSIERRESERVHAMYTVFLLRTFQRGGPSKLTSDKEHRKGVEVEALNKLLINPKMWTLSFECTVHFTFCIQCTVYMYMLAGSKHICSGQSPRRTLQCNVCNEQYCS